MEQLKSKNNNSLWHIDKWPFLAWLETFVKVSALCIGVYALTVTARPAVQLALPTGIKLAQFTIQAILILGLIAAIYDRLQEHEIIAMIFLVFNILGHIGILAALSNTFFSTNLLTSFWMLMLLGEIIKLFFLRIHQFSVRNTPAIIMYGLTSVYLLGYLALIMLQMVV